MIAKKNKVLFINTPNELVYKKSNVKFAVSEVPSLSMAVIATVLLDNGYDVKICELSMEKEPWNIYNKALDSFTPDFLLINFTTATFGIMKKFVNEAKKRNPECISVGGGSHTSYYPEQSVRDSPLDFAVVGEGDFAALKILDSVNAGKPLKDIKGIAFKDEGKPQVTPKAALIQDLDSLPMPAWHLFDLSRYKANPFVTRANPVGSLETSRGCIFRCTFCSATVFGKTWRAKSATRVVAEIEHMIKAGFKEIHVLDDMFTTDKKRIHDIHRIMKEKGIKIPINLRVGIRVNSFDKEMAIKLKEMGIYRVSLGVESGNQEIIWRTKKAITLDSVRQAVRICKEVGIETVTFFIIGLPGATEATLNDTINFAIEIDPFIAKATIACPSPGTEFFQEYKEKGLLKEHNWENYTFHDPSEVFDHENLSWPTIKKYYKKFYRKFYLRPGFIARRLVYTIKKGTLINDIKAGLQVKWF